MNTTLLTVGLGVVFLAVLAVPFISKKIEHNLELFLFCMGLIAATVSGIWGWGLVEEALLEPIKISVAVLIAGLVFHIFRLQVRNGVTAIIHRVPFRPFIFVIIVVLGLLSSFISAIIAALILVEIVGAVDMERKRATRLVIVGCFSIGLGAALTPLGEPLATIAIAKLKGEPFHAGFFFLVDIIGVYVVPSVIVLGIVGAFLVGRHRHHAPELRAAEIPERIGHIGLRAGKVYLFVMALILLGNGFKPLIDLYFSHAPSYALYWANSASAILDNATLAAAEVGPTLNAMQIRAALIGLLISGGALIPGNIPNIISASKLKIGSGEWAKIGIPLAAIMMAVLFPIVILIK